MARIKRQLIIRRDGETTEKTVYTPQVVKRPSPKTWEKVCMTGSTDEQRKRLTNGQWAEYSELRRGLHIIDPNMMIEDASLSTLRDIMRTVNIMDCKVAIHRMSV